MMPRLQRRLESSILHECRSGFLDLDSIVEVDIR